MRLDYLLGVGRNQSLCQRFAIISLLQQRQIGWFVACVLVLLWAMMPVAQAADKFCSDAPFYGVIDGDVLANAPTQITIDTTCTFQNWPIENPLSTNINFQTNDPSIYLIIFDNVYHTGNMACANIPHKLWVVNSRDDAFSVRCQEFIIPAETIDKQSPISSVGIGEQFTYRLVLPSMDYPQGQPSPNDIGDVVITDDLSATGASLTLVGTPTVTFADTGMPVGHTFTQSTADGGLLTFVFDNTILSGQQIYIDITVEVDDAPTTNIAGTQIVNTAEWVFSRSIDLDENGIIEDGTVDLDGDGLIEDEFFNPLPGESGIADPITIAEPDLIVTKTANQTAMNIGVTAKFTLDVQNAGGADAWDITITDLLPRVPAAPAGMCETDPSVSLTAEVFAADGVTSVSGPLIANTDYVVSHSGFPACQFSVTTLSANAVVGPSERLIITYESQLDSDTTGDNEPLVNIAGADLWFSGPNSVSSRREFDTTLTDGTPAVEDFQDSYTVTTALSGYYFEKTATNTVTGALPAVTANVGDRIRYTLRLFNVDQTINNIVINDTLDSTEFDLASFSMIDAGGADYRYNNVTGELILDGGTGSLDVAQGNDLTIVYEIDLRTTLSNGYVVENQASLQADQNTASTADDFSALSDDPYTNGVSDPTVDGDEDPTPVTIQTPGPLSKTTTQATAAIGEHFTYLVTIPATPINSPLYNVHVLEDLTSSSADIRFISATVQSGGSWVLSNTGTATNVVLQDLTTGIDIPAGSQAVIAITVELQNTLTNQAGLTFTNTASYTFGRNNDPSASQIAGGADVSGSMTVVEPQLSINKAFSFVSPAGKSSTDNAAVGDVLEYTVSLTNTGDSTAYDLSVTDSLPTEVQLVPGSAQAVLNGTAVSGFVTSPDTQTSGALIWGDLNEDSSLDVPVGQTLLLTYQVAVNASTDTGILNSVVAEWSSRNGENASERDGLNCPTVTALDDYCVGPATVTVTATDASALHKQVVSDSYAETPPSTGDPLLRVGDTVIYQLTLDLPEYTTRDVRIDDNLPGGMAYDSLVSISPASGASNFTYTVNAQPAAGDVGTLSWDLGDVINSPSGDGTPLDSLVIQYQAKVITDTAPQGLGTASRYDLTNNAAMSYMGGDPALHPERLTDTAAIDVLQPLMSAISKRDTGSGRVGTGTSSDPYQVNILNDTMAFEVSSCNNGLAPAYGVIFRDQLATELDETDLLSSPPQVTVGGAALISGVDFNLTIPTRGGVMEIALLDSAPVNPGDCVTVTYNMGFHSDIAPFSTWNNTAMLTQYRSLPLSEVGRVYSPATSAQVFMTNQIGISRLAKVLMSGNEATIGDEVVYELRVPAVAENATLNNVIVTDTLSAELEYLSASAVDGAGNPVVLVDNTVTPGDIQLQVAQIPAGEQVFITLTTRVLNNTAANAGDRISNRASYRYTGLDPAADTSGISEPFTLVEPSLSIDKAVVNLTTPGAAPIAGDVLRYSLTFSAMGGASDDNFTDAFDLQIDDSLGLGLLYLTGTAAVNGAGNSITDPQLNSGDGISLGQTLTWDLGSATADIDVPEGAQVTVSYDVQVLGGVQAGQTLTNRATVEWTGQDGSDPAERSGSQSPDVNDYVAGPVQTRTLTRLDVDVIKSVVNTTTGQSPGVDAEPGDVLRYRIELTNNSIIPVDNMAFTDVLDAAFVADSLQWLTYPTGADISGTLTAGGSNGTGLLDLRNVSLAASGDVSGNDSVTLEFSAQLASVLDHGTQVQNTAFVSGDNLAKLPSNTTVTTIASAPSLRVEKTSSDLTGDASSLQPGDTLRYTLTVKNLGNEDATAVTLNDLVPTFTTYVAGSTTLNGVVVDDPSVGVSALRDGLAISTLENPGSGLMPADPDDGAGYDATITFDVTVNDGVVGGTAISNQGFVNGEGTGSGEFVETPSDDPDTPAVNDPTVDVVGDVALLDAHKTVQLVVDNGSLGVVDPDDVLRYTIVIHNQGVVDASGVQLVDTVPANTQYVANSLRVNSQPWAQPDGGVSPLENGIAVQSDNGALSGVVLAGASSTITFEVSVDSGVTPGTLIRNQGVVSSQAQDDEPTDADGIDSNGDQPTDVIVGNIQLLSIIEEVFDVNGDVVLAGDELEYVVTVTNIGSLPARDVTLSTNLDAPIAGQLQYVADSGRLQGSTSAVTYLDPNLSADYATRFGDLDTGDSVVLRFRAVVDPAQVTGSTITNTTQVLWNAGNQSDSASASVVIGAPPGETAAVGGSAWHDINDDKIPNADETSLVDWQVSLYRNGALLANTRTDDLGQYRFMGLSPNMTSSTRYSIRFAAPYASDTTAMLGMADSPFDNGLQSIQQIQVSGSSVTDTLNLPLLPNGVLYNSITRDVVGGAVIEMLNAGSLQVLPDTCFDDPNQQGQQVAVNGFYRFDMNFSAAACSTSGSYLLRVTAPSASFEAGVSRLIPPQSDETTAAFDVPACLGSPDDAVPATINLCEVAVSAEAPSLSVPARSAGTEYHLHLALNNGQQPGQSQLFNNHIPLDPILDNAVAVRKVAGKVNVSRGDLVPYTITIKNSYLAALQDLVLVDTFPPGFKYVEGSARYNGEALEPQLVGGQLRWDNLDLSLDAESELQLLFIPGSGVSEGEYINRAHVESVYTGESVSNSASAAVRVVPDPTLDCSDIYGKVFDDVNFNGHPDPGERGIAGARVVSARGLLISADEHGRFHLTCAAVPNELRGSNFILKVDERSLPSGYRMTSENPRVIRLTRGKAAKFNFGASLHRVVRLDVADGVFELNSTDMRPQWLPRLPLLLAELQKAPSIVRVAYLAEVEDEKLVQARVKHLKTMITEQWESMDCCYTLNVETEVYWRRGSPPDRSGVLQ